MFLFLTHPFFLDFPVKNMYLSFDNSLILNSPFLLTSKIIARLNSVSAFIIIPMLAFLFFEGPNLTEVFKKKFEIRSLSKIIAYSLLLLFLLTKYSLSSIIKKFSPDFCMGNTSVFS